MKYLLGIYTCLIIAVAVVAAQQETPTKPTPSIQTTAEALMKAQAAADKAQTRRDEPSTEELKKLVEREIAKSAALPVTTTMQAPIAQSIQTTQTSQADPANQSGKGKKVGLKSGLILIDGALYIRVGDSIMPAAGGGASGCFSVSTENAAKLHRAQMKFAEMNKAELDKTEPVKKD